MDANSRRLVIAVVCVLPALAGAEDKPAPAVSTAPEPHTVSRFRDPEDGMLDLSTYLATPKRFLPVPIVITEPAIGYGGGIAGMFVRPRKDVGSEGFARPNISLVGGFATENGTGGAIAGDSSRDRQPDRLAARASGPPRAS